MTHVAQRRLFNWLGALAAVMLGLVAIALLAPAAGQVRPAVLAAGSAAQGPCLLPAPQMRRSHMDLLYHERALAVRQGIRDPDARLQRCVTCHAVRDASGAPVSFDDQRHFCRSCHDQAAVGIDCFSCHRSTPATSVATGGAP